MHATAVAYDELDIENGAPMVACQVQADPYYVCQVLVGRRCFDLSVRSSAVSVEIEGRLGATCPAWTQGRSWTMKAT